MRSISIRQNNQYANKKIIRRMLIVVTLIAMSLLAAFWLIAYENLDSRAERSIRMFLQDRDRYYEDATTFAVFEVYLGENLEMPWAGSTDEKLAILYRDHPERFPLNTYMRYRDPETFMVYYTTKVSSRLIGQPERVPQCLVFYCDISYELKLVHNNVLVIAGVLAAFIFLLFVVSRYTLKTLDKKDKEIKNFFANASHELKTPLMAIKGNADGICNGYVEPKDGCEIIEKEADRMAGLISSILDISRLDSGMVVPDVVRTDVREIVYDAVSSVMQEAANRKITIDVDIPEPVFRECDESMLYSAFSNILTNAIRYAGSAIRVFTEMEGSKARFVFENDGTPISDEDREHVFDRFYKGGDGKTGLGMALAQEYVKLHGSEITVQAGEGCTRFVIAL